MGFAPHENQEANDVSDAEVDALMEKYESGAADGPTILADEEAPAAQTADAPAAAALDKTSPATTQAPGVTAKTPAQAQTPAEQEFELPGTSIRAPLSKILKWAGQGRDYAQKMAEFKTQREGITHLESQYRPIDEWVRANPDKWEKLQAVIKAEQQGMGDLPPNHPILQKLGEFESVIKEITSERQQARVQKEDQELDAEIKSIRDKFKDLDWVKADGTGRTREQLVVDHAVKNGIKTFKAAFFDLYHDEIIQTAEMRAREQFASQKEKQAKSGLLKSSAPGTSGLSQPKKNTKNYPGADEILKELGMV